MNIYTPAEIKEMFPKAFGQKFLTERRYTHMSGFVVAIDVFGYYKYVGIDNRIVTKLSIAHIKEELLQDYLKIRDAARKKFKVDGHFEKGDIVVPTGSGHYLKSYKTGVVDHVGQFTVSVLWDGRIVIYCYPKDIKHA